VRRSTAAQLLQLQLLLSHELQAVRHLCRRHIVTGCAPVDRHVQAGEACQLADGGLGATPCGGQITISPGGRVQFAQEGLMLCSRVS
jgi:hypothetical protein